MPLPTLPVLNTILNYLLHIQNLHYAGIKTLINTPHCTAKHEKSPRKTQQFFFGFLTWKVKSPFWLLWWFLPIKKNVGNRKFSLNSKHKIFKRMFYYFVLFEIVIIWIRGKKKVVKILIFLLVLNENCPMVFLK